MPHFEVGTITALSPGREGVNATSAIIIPENLSRSGLILTNISSGTIYLGIGNTATMRAGIVLTPNGGNWSMDDYTYSKQAITAIGDSGTLIVAYQEFVNLA